MDRENAFGLDHHRHRREIAHGVVGHFGEQELVDRVRANEAHHQGVAIGRGLGDHIGTDTAAAAGAVFHHPRLAPGFKQFAADQA